MHYAEMLPFSMFCRNPDTKAIHKCLFIWKGRKDKIYAMVLLWIHVYRYPMPFKRSLPPRSPPLFVSTVHFLSVQILAGPGTVPLLQWYFFVCWFGFFNIPLWVINPKKPHGGKLLGWEFFNMLIRLRSVPELCLFVLSPIFNTL